MSPPTSPYLIYLQSKHCIYEGSVVSHLTNTPSASPHDITMTAEKQGHKDRWSKVTK